MVIFQLILISFFINNLYRRVRCRVCFSYQHQIKQYANANSRIRGNAMQAFKTFAEGMTNVVKSSVIRHTESFLHKWAKREFEGGVESSSEDSSTLGSPKPPKSKLQMTIIEAATNEAALLVNYMFFYKHIRVYPIWVSD